MCKFAEKSLSGPSLDSILLLLVILLVILVNNVHLDVIKLKANHPTTPLNELHHEKTNNVVSEQVQHKSSCTSTEDGYRLKILN